MTDIILCGCLGKMGKIIAQIVSETDNMKIIAGVDFAEGSASFPIYKKIDDVKESADAIIDFSHPSLLSDVLNFSVKKGIPAVIATTGLSEEQKNQIVDSSEKVAVFYTANFSLGINLMAKLISDAAKILCEKFDIEIIEKHHNQKIDAPSGTALLLADTLSQTLPFECEYVYDRHSQRKKRTAHEIGLHAVRGGTIVGEHEVIFAGHDEVITISHSAQSKEVFAEGAIRAAEFIARKKTGLYDMKNLIN